MTKRRIVTDKIEWRGILLVIRHQHDYLWPGTSHVEVHVVRPKRAVIPITETGYRSHFIDREELSLAGGAVTFVIAWLDREAARRKWQRAEIEAQQLKFDL